MRVAISSCSGRISSLLLAAIVADPHFELTHVFARESSNLYQTLLSEHLVGAPDIVIGAPCVDSLREVDVLIDFSLPIWTEKLIPLCIEAQTKMVIGTTGFVEAQRQQIVCAAEHIGIVFDSNMSLGMNLMHLLVQNALSVLDPSYAIELSECHHIHKKDAPSGTFKKMISAIDQIEQRRGFSFQRSLQIKRVGEHYGEHKLICSSPKDQLEISHTAHDRGIFVEGALQAALFINVHPDAGLFSMLNVLQRELCCES